MKRCVNELGFVGFQIGSHVNSLNLDDASFDMIYKVGFSADDQLSECRRMNTDSSRLEHGPVRPSMGHGHMGGSTTEILDALVGW
jgi:hypothetical protein